MSLNGHPGLFVPVFACLSGLKHVERSGIERGYRKRIMKMATATDFSAHRQWIDDADSQIIYNGNWSEIIHPQASNGGFHQAEGPANTVHLRFTGSKINYYYWLSTLGGFASLLIDGRFITTIPYYSPVNYGGFFNCGMTTENLNNGEHELVLTSIRGLVNVDGFEVSTGD